MRGYQQQVPEGERGGPAQLDEQQLQRGLPDGQRAGEARVLAAGPVADRRRDEHVPAGRGQPVAQRHGDVGIGGQRQVRAVLLGGADRYREYGAGRGEAGGAG